MESYKLRVHFEKDSFKKISAENDDIKSALEYVTGHKECFYPDEEKAIDMRKVSYITKVKPVRAVKNSF